MDVTITVESHKLGDLEAHVETLEVVGEDGKADLIYGLRKALERITSGYGITIEDLLDNDEAPVLSVVKDPTPPPPWQSGEHGATVSESFGHNGRSYRFVWDRGHRFAVDYFSSNARWQQVSWFETSALVSLSDDEAREKCDEWWNATRMSDMKRGRELAENNANELEARLKR